MYNLKKVSGSYKGWIGECLFKVTRKYVILTRFFSKNKYFKIFEDKLTNDEKQFLDKNWFSIDALEFDYTKLPRRLVLYEVKTLNDYFNSKLNGLNRIPKITLNSYKMYTEALVRGFDVKVVFVWLRNSWNYDIEIFDFNKCKYYVDKPKLYDKVATFYQK